MSSGNDPYPPTLESSFSLSDNVDLVLYGSIIVIILGLVINQTVPLPVAAAGLFVTTAFYATYRKLTNKSDLSISGMKIIPPTEGKEGPDENKNGKNKNVIKDIWQAGKGSSNDGSQKKAYNDKPFGSKYYYAHNNPNATGGYKDGLRMEDYRMNGPRLLSKGGKPATENGEDSGDTEKVDTAKEPESADGESKISSTSTVKSNNNAKVGVAEPPLLQISKYLWDDPGDWNGVATIRIDSLPQRNGTGGGGGLIPWKDANVESVEAKLAGEGLTVKVVADKVNYQLKINKLYGDAAEVKTVTKPKRLLVKIHKKKTAVFSALKDKNMEAWPQPHRKV